MHFRRVVSFALVALAMPAFAQDYAGVKVSEADYAAYQKIRYAQALAEKRAMYDRANKAKYDAEKKAAVQSAGWTQERFGQVEGALGELRGNEPPGGDGQNEKDWKALLSGYDQTTVATYRAHSAELRHDDTDARAEAEVRKERAEAQAGDAPTAAALQGTWIADIDATLDRMLGGNAGGELKEKMRKQVGASMEGNSYQFGPGDAIVATAKGPDGKVRVDKGTFRLDGRTVYFRSPGSKAEQSLQAGFSGGRLLLGVGMMSVVYRKK